MASNYTRSAKYILLLFCFLSNLQIPPAAALNTLPLQASNENSVAPSEKVAYDIPLTFDRQRCLCPSVMVSINGHPPLPFLLDTGTSLDLVFTPESVKALQLQPTQETQLVNGKFKALVVRVESIAFPTVNNPNRKQCNITNPHEISPIVFNLPLPKDGDSQDGDSHFAGIVGVNMFIHATVKLDFAAQMMTVFLKTPTSLLTNFIKLPLQEKRTAVFTVPLQADALHSYDFLVDTGCFTTEIPTDAVPLLGVRETSFAYATHPIEGRQEHTFGILPRLPIGSPPCENVGVVYPENHKTKGRAILGMNVLCRYILVMDFPNHQLYLQPAANAAEMAQLPSLSIVSVSRHGSTVHVADIIPGSAADRAGLQKGDILLKVDGKSVEDISTSLLQKYVDGYGGTAATLMVQRQGQEKTLSYHRYSIKVTAVAADIGLDVHFSSSRYLVVDKSEKTFSAYVAGIRKGDEILAIGALSVETTDYERLLQAICNPPSNPLVLTVQRRGEAQPRQVLVKW